MSHFNKVLKEHFGDIDNLANLARRIGVDRKKLHKWLYYNQVPMMNDENLEAIKNIAEYLKLPLGDVLYGNRERQNVETITTTSFRDENRTYHIEIKKITNHGDDE